MIATRLITQSKIYYTEGRKLTIYQCMKSKDWFRSNAKNLLKMMTLREIVEPVGKKRSKGFKV